MSRLAAVIFDVDGTLVDSERDGHRVAFNAAFEEAGLPDRWDVATYGQLLKITGGANRMAFWFENTGRSPVEAWELAERLHKRKTLIMRRLVEEGRVHARPGALQLIDELGASSVQMHVATTGTRAWVEPLLNHAFGDRFDTVVTGTEVSDLKPSPAVYLEVLNRIGCEPERAVAVEDSANGVRAAVGAGLRCVAAHNPYTREDDLSGATLIADGLNDPALVANASASAASWSAKAPRTASSFDVSPTLKRTFSSTATWPSWSAPTTSAALSPTVSVANTTGEPRSSPSRAATGAREYAGAGAPSGRPRCAVTTTRAPASASAWMVGTLDRIRPSSVMTGVSPVPLSRGTFRSERTSTVRPRRSPSSAARSSIEPMLTASGPRR